MTWTWLRNPKILSALIFIILIALIWFAGPLLGLKSVESRFAWIFFLMLLWVVILMVGKVIKDRSAALLENVLRRKADDAVVSASPEKRAEVALLRQRLLAAIATLKTSNLGKTRGKAALYELPWYMIVGHPSAGKSCAILNSGLKFPLEGKGGVTVQGIGGTRNCDWFFSTEGVLLDTAGRYSTQTEDRVEWVEFLKLLKKHRSRAPLNGILVALSFPELIQHQSEYFALYARQVRQRINEVDDIFGVKIPVYLVFTKIDLLRGFSQFFEDLGEDERKMVWGTTLTHDQRPNFNLPQVVGQNFEDLFRGLSQMGMDKLAGNRANQKRPALFAFPLEFHGLKTAICKFAELLVEPDPYHTKPLIRGFYFTSALQETSPMDASGNRISGQFDLTKHSFKPTELAGSRPYFLESLFRKVIFPDMFLVGRQASPKRSRARLAGILAGLGLMALLAGFWTWSLAENQKLISASQVELGTARRLYHQGNLRDKMTALQVLQLRIEQLHRYRKDGHPWKLGWGLYRGNEVERALREEYFSELRQTMLLPVKQELERKLMEDPDAVNAPPAAAQGPERTPQGKHHLPGKKPAYGAKLKLEAPNQAAAPTETGANKAQETYNALKTYIMLNDPKLMEMPHLTDQLPRHWRPWLEANAPEGAIAEIIRMAERTVAFYVSQIKEPDLPRIDIRWDIVERVRAQLRGAQAQLSPLERLYNILKAQGDPQFPPVTVASILNNKDMDLIGASAVVSGNFTRQGWEKYFRDAIYRASRGEFKGVDWVLDSSLDDALSKLGTPEENQTKLVALYKADYAKEWGKFLQGVAIHDFGDFDRAAAALGKLGDPQNSPIKLVLMKVAQETAWDNPSELSKSLTTFKDKVVQRTETLLGSTPASSQTNPALGEVGGKFAPIAAMVNPADGGRAPIDAYLELLTKMKGRLSGVSSSGDPGGAARQLVQATFNGSGSELAEAQQYIDGALLGRMDEASKEIVRPILVRPLLQGFSVLAPASEQDINRAWTQQVYGQWSNLSSKYPFADSANEAQWGDIVKFLKPGEGTLARFMDKYVGPLAVRRGDAYSARSWCGQGVGLGPAFLGSVSRLMEAGNLFMQEGDSSKFELQPCTTPGLSEIIIEIDGQKIQYRNGPQAWSSFTWPGQTATQGARIQVTSFNGVTLQVHNLTGRLGLMRLLDQSHAENASGSTSSLAWRFKVPPTFSGKATGKEAGREDYYPHAVKFNFRMVSGTNPLRLNVLRHHSLPARVGN